MRQLLSVVVTFAKSILIFIDTNVEHHYECLINDFITFVENFATRLRL